jgi:hypothetical protein
MGVGWTQASLSQTRSVQQSPREPVQGPPTDLQKGLAAVPVVPPEALELAPEPEPVPEPAVPLAAEDAADVPVEPTDRPVAPLAVPELVELELELTPTLEPTSVVVRELHPMRPTAKVRTTRGRVM